MRARYVILHLRLLVWMEYFRLTRTVAPEVTEGPYYHQVGHPIRQNIAEFQFGLLTVRITASR